ncbi:FMN-dependent NADH-azoreductase [Bisbaumannia pacifica]|uniref:FMN dependent NADH:quinone oxidoreductase n=1 Tax=Bisbaumannia pacifica TaxID=77098 RepID=A0ABD4KXY3_9GAMM|nr:NAD(P)H-dependent oxidoreductase [Halomonas pacifica]MBH8579169.1 NAD(P)H-dependent oxidoreductase [Halomonas pacifica]
MTTKILVITSSILGGNSQALADHLVAQAARRDDLSVTRRDLVADDLPHLGLAELGSWQVAAAERSAGQQALAARSDALIEELNAHDQVVLAVPMYNFGVPSQLKAWFDRVMRAGVTFRYTESGPQGLVEGKRALLLLARGGQYAGTPMDTQTPHLKAMLGMIGISEVDSIFAEGLNMGHQEAAMGEAKTAIEQWVAQL